VGRGDVGVGVLAEVLEDEADRFELDAGVEQALDDAELEQVAVGVQTAAAAPSGRRERWLDQPGARPVVELAVRDADDLGDARAAVPGVAVGGRRQLRGCAHG
jgi:hypothetical protein